MKELYKRIRRFLKTYGLRATIRRAVVLILNKDPYRAYVYANRTTDAKIIFTKIYEANLWASNETKSGRGSTLEYTEQLRTEIPLALERFGVNVFIDAPCGDFNWMRNVVLPEHVRYVGLDIVSSIIEENRKRYSDTQRSFFCADVTRSDLPAGDLLLCRDCLFHLSYSDIYNFFANFARSDVKYLMTSTHKNLDDFPNKDIPTGAFRVLDLFSVPFTLPKDVCHRFDDYAWPDPPRELCVWTREQIKSALPVMAQKLRLT